MPTEFAVSTGEGFGRARRLMDLSLRQVADEMRVPHTSLARWERDPRPLGPERVLSWSEALKRCEVKRLRAVRRAAAGRRWARILKNEQERA